MMNKFLALKISSFGIVLLGFVLAIYTILPLFSTTTQAAGLVPNGALGQAYNWSLIFQDEFNGSAVDTTKWSSCINWGYGSTPCYENSNQKEWYSTANRIQSGGMLNLQAKSQSNGAFEYSSGFINSDRDSDTTAVPAKFDFRYGYAEIRAKIPKGKGVWPAFWLLPSDHTTSSEIDVLEILGDHPEKNYMTYHYGSHQEVSGNYTIPGTDFSQNFHTYAVDWQADSITWYIDGAQVYRITSANAPLPNEAGKKFYLIANLQVGGPWAGDPNGSTVFPANYYIDYIRVWNKGAAIQPPTSTPIRTPTHVPTQIPGKTSVPTTKSTTNPILSVTPTLAHTITITPSELDGTLAPTSIISEPGFTETPDSTDEAPSETTTTQNQAWWVKNLLLIVLIGLAISVSGLILILLFKRKKEDQVENHVQT